MMKGLLISRKALLFFRYYIIQIRADVRVFCEDTLIEQDDIRFSQRADGEFALERMTDFAHNDDVQGKIQRMSNFRGDNHTTARKAQHQVGFHPLLPEKIG